MKRSVTSARSSLWFTAGLALLVSIFLSAATGSLALIYLRRQIETTAERLYDSQRQQADLERRLESLDARIAAVHQPEALRLRATALGLNLRAPERTQIVRMGPLTNPYPAQDPNQPVVVAPAREGRSFDNLSLEPLTPIRRLN